MDPSCEDQPDKNDEATLNEDHESSEKHSESIDEVTTDPMDCTITLSGDEEETALDENNGDEKVMEQTLPPGAAPSGFAIVDEVYCDKDEKQDEDEKTPLITISFRDNDVAGRYKKKFMTFLNDIIVKKNERCTTQWKNLTLEVWGTLCDESTETGDDSANSETVSDNFDGLFVVDTTPTIKDDLDIPTYGKKFDKILNKNGIQELPTDEGKPPKMTCFNCLGNHNLKDCTQPRNQANINKHRKDFNSRQRSNTRYHQDDDQKFDHLVPGKLSDNLKQALNLKENELPRYIYRMRQLGYPPGWLEEAKLQHSGLSLFNSLGVAEGDPDDEEGEIINYANKDRYDINKIIEFPGFNVRPPRGTFDELKHYWGTELQIRNSKLSMLNELMDRKVDEGYKKKKLKKGAPIALDSKTEAKDMEIEILDEDVVIETVSENGLFVPPLPRDDAKPPEPPVTLEDSDGHESSSPTSTQEESGAVSPRGDSPSLSDLEFAKNNILTELEDSSSQPNPESLPKSEASLDTSVSETETSPPGTDSTPQNKSQSKPSTPGSNRGNIKFVDLGTPIIKSASPYNKLPSSEKFSKDICDVIYFENLPDSTGKYEQMSGLIQKVRSKLAEINKE